MAVQKEASVLSIWKSSRSDPKRPSMEIECLLFDITFSISGSFTSGLDGVTSGLPIEWDLFFSFDFRCLAFGSGNFCATTASNKLFCLSMYLSTVFGVTETDC